MSIQIKEVITVEDYNDIFPNTSSADRIRKAISLAFFIIDGVCSAAISDRWDYVGPDETKILTEIQKDLIRKAFLVQTQYIISCNLDITNQSQSISVGGLSFNNNKPQINQLCESARNYLLKADLFYKTYFVGTNGKGSNCWFEDFKEFVTYSVGDKRYLMTEDKNPTHWEKFIYINNQGQVEYKSISDIINVHFADILGNPYDNTLLSEALGEKADNSSLRTEREARIAADNQLNTAIQEKSTVSVSATGTALDEVEYITVNGVEKKIKSGGSSGASIVPITWSELKTLKDNSQLVAGQWYRITDYTTLVKESTDYISAQHPFDIIVFALETNKLSEVAFASLHEGDTYFATSNLQSWELRYCIDNNTDRFEWVDDTCKGAIYWMKDDKENSMYYDFKNIKTKGNGTTNFCYTFTNGDSLDNVDRSITSSSVFGNTIGARTSSGKYLINMNVFYGTSTNNNTIAGDSYNNTITGSLSGNVIGESFHNNTIATWFNYNLIRNGFIRNTIGDGFNHNYIGDNFESNIIGNDSFSNTIGNSFRNNTFSDSSYSISRCNVADGIQNKTFTKSYSNTTLYLNQEKIS